MTKAINRLKINLKCFILGVMFLDTPYIRNPRSLKLLAKEIIRITDDYWTGKISEMILKDYLHYVASNTKLLANNGEDINITVKLAIGKKRTALVMKMLEGYQIRIM